MLYFNRYVPLLANFTSDQQLELMKAGEEYCSLSYITNNQEIMIEINNRVYKTAALFLDMSSRPILEINFGNYIEHILFTILRDDIIELPFFLKNCFN